MFHALKDLVGQVLLETELAQLEAFNCARYRLAIGKTEEWIAKGRPA
jgi:hypothetical protein